MTKKTRSPNPTGPVNIETDRVCGVFLSPRQLGGRWGCSEKALAHARCKGTGVPYRVLSGRIRYALSDIEAYEAQALRTNTSQDGRNG